MTRGVRLSPLVTASQGRTYSTNDGGEAHIRVTGAQLTMVGVHGRVVQNVDLGAHPLQREVLRYIEDRANTLALATIRLTLDSLDSLGRFLTERRYRDFSATVHGEFLVWMRDGGVSRNENGQFKSSVHCAALYEHNIGRTTGWTRSDLDDMADARRAHFRGLAARDFEAAQVKAVSFDEVARLVRACRMEMESCTRRLMAWNRLREWADRQGYSPPDALAARRGFDPNPYVVFALLAGLLNHVRAAEVYSLDVGDDERRVGFLWVHAPNKPAAYVPLDEDVARSLSLAQAWSKQFRSIAIPGDECAMLLYRPFAVRGAAGIARAERVNSSIMSTRWLARFYAKYHRLLDAATGKPVLYADPSADGAALEQFGMSIKEARNAGLAAYARIERDPAALQRRSRHRYRKTLERHYLVEAERERLDETAQRLAPMAERMRMKSQARLDGETHRDDARLAARGALVPMWVRDASAAQIAGHCASAVTDDTAAAAAAGFRPGCVRSGDCRLCRHFRIHTERRALFVAARDFKVGQAATLIEAGNLREAENTRESAALDQAIIDCIDDHLRGSRL